VSRHVARALQNVENETELGEVRRDVRKMCERFPLYAGRLAAYEKVLAKA
jgi:glycine hydroxymethyltransferase